MRKQRHKHTNTGDKVIAHHSLVMPVDQKSETKFTLHSHCTKISFVFTRNSLHTNQALMSMHQWLLWFWPKLNSATLWHKEMFRKYRMTFLNLLCSNLWLSLLLSYSKSSITWSTMCDTLASWPCNRDGFKEVLKLQRSVWMWMCELWRLTGGKGTEFPHSQATIFMTGSLNSIITLLPQFMSIWSEIYSNNKPSHMSFLKLSRC